MSERPFIDIYARLSEMNGYMQCLNEMRDAYKDIDEVLAHVESVATEMAQEAEEMLEETTDETLRGAVKKCVGALWALSTVRTGAH